MYHHINLRTRPQFQGAKPASLSCPLPPSSWLSVFQASFIKALTVGDSCISLRLLSPLTDSSQESESHVIMIAMLYVRVRTRCVSCWRPTFHVASSSSVLFCVCVCEWMFFMGEGLSAELYSGHLMPRAHEHICLSGPAEASCVL